MVQFHPRSLDNDWSVGVSVARVRGKDEDRVQFPDGPLNEWACMPLGATDPCKVGVMGSTPIRSTEQHGLMVQRDDASSAGWRSGFNSRWVHCYGR
jgi:hypothetical protein